MHGRLEKIFPLLEEYPTTKKQKTIKREIYLLLYEIDMQIYHRTGFSVIATGDIQNVEKFLKSLTKGLKKMNEVELIHTIYKPLPQYDILSLLHNT